MRAAHEQVFRNALDAIPLLVSFVTSDERYRYGNAAYESWFGTPRQQLLGRTLLEVVGEAAYVARAAQAAQRHSWADGSRIITGKLRLEVIQAGDLTQ